MLCSSGRRQAKNLRNMTVPFKLPLLQIKINKYIGPDCALFCCKGRQEAVEHEKSVGENTRRSRVFFPTS